MNLHETKKVLAVLHVDSGKLPSESKSIDWAGKLDKVPYSLGMAAAHRMRRLTRNFGEPQFSDYREHVNALWRAYRASRKGLSNLDPALMVRMSDEQKKKRAELLKDISDLREQNILTAPDMPRLEGK